MKICLLLFLAAITQIRAATLTTEHADFGINFNSAALAQPGGPWRLTVRDEDNQTEYLGQRSGKDDPQRVVLSASISGRTNIPDDSRYTFLGPVGANVWVLPQSQDSELLFLGASLENKSSDAAWVDEGVGAGFLMHGVSSGVFQSNQIALRLATFSGPGNFFLYFTNSFGDPVVYFNTADGLSAVDQRLFSPTNHVHFNWAFTAPGSYTVGLRASGTLVSGNAFTESDITTFRFVVAPEPSTALLLAASATLLAARRRRKIAPALLALAAFPSLAAHGYTTIADEHVDLRIDFAGGVLDGKIRADNEGNIPRDEGLFFDGPTGTTSVARPAGATWDFLGVAAGEPIYYWPQSSVPERMYLGFGADHGSIPAGSLASYLESDPRVNVAAPWVKIALTAVRYEAAPGESGAPDFSLWQTGSFGPPVVWMSTALGGITATDATWLLEGGHAHFNWGFTKRGYYQLDFKFSGFHAGSTAPIESTTQTYHFGVEYAPPTIPTDLAARGSVLTDRAPVDFRINTPGTTGSIALASADTRIRSLLQNTTTPATVDTAGKTLHAARIEIASGMAPLTIGAQSGDGTLASSDLFLAANDPAAALTIHAAITAATVTKTGPGPLEIHGLQSFGALHAEAGTTRFYNSATLAALTIGAGAEVILASATTPLFSTTPTTKPNDDIMKTKHLLPLALLTAALPLQALPVLTNEHVDVDIAFELGNFALGLHDETNDIEYAADEAILQVGFQGYELIPNDPAYSFLGAIGVDHVWRLPKVQNVDLLLLGTGTVEIDPGTLDGELLTLTLLSVVHGGGGKFTLYDVDPFNNPIIYMNSGDGISGIDKIVLPTGNHADFNWTFSEAGTYEVTLQTSGTVGGLPVSEQATYTFEVVPVPEPTSALLAALGLAACSLRRFRRRA